MNDNSKTMMGWLGLIAFGGLIVLVLLVRSRRKAATRVEDLTEVRKASAAA